MLCLKVFIRKTKTTNEFVKIKKARLEKWRLYDQIPARELRSETFLLIFRFGPGRSWGAIQYKMIYLSISFKLDYLLMEYGVVIRRMERYCKCRHFGL